MDSGGNLGKKNDKMTITVTMDQTQIRLKLALNNQKIKLTVV